MRLKCRVGGHWHTARGTGSKEKQPVGGAQLEELLSTARARAGAQWAREQRRAPFKYFKITYKGRIKRSEIPFNRTNKEITIYSISLEKASWMGFFPPSKKEKGKEGGKRRIMCVYSSKEKNI